MIFAIKMSHIFCHIRTETCRELMLVSVSVDVEQILVQLLPNIPEMMLFMKNLRKVKVCIIQEGSQGAAVLSTYLRADRPLPSVFLPGGQSCCMTAIKSTASKSLPVKGVGLPDDVEVASSKMAWFKVWDDVSAVAVLLNGSAPAEGKIFCGMPLPLFAKNLQVHINGEII